MKLACRMLGHDMQPVPAEEIHATWKRGERIYGVKCGRCQVPIYPGDTMSAPAPWIYTWVPVAAGVLLGLIVIAIHIHWGIQ